jgi:hypothetical protein
MIHSTKYDRALPSEFFRPLLARQNSNPDVENVTSGMDFNSIVLYLKAKGVNARKIPSDLVATLGTKVPGYSL